MANFPSCPGVDLDIFYKEGWHAAGSTPHPVEFLFYKTNRGVGADALAARSSVRDASTKYHARAEIHAIERGRLIFDSTQAGATSVA